MEALSIEATERHRSHRIPPALQTLGYLAAGLALGFLFPNTPIVLWVA